MMEKKEGCFGRKTCQRLRSNRGVSFAELLITLLILSLSSAGMAGGVLFAKEQYRASMVLSESKVLCSTLSDSIKDALRNAKNIQVDSNNRDFQFEAKDWRGGKSHIETLNSQGEKADYGELWIVGTSDSESNNKRMASSASYSSYHLQAKAAISYVAEEELFHVTLTIRDAARGQDVIENHSFDVFVLNPVKIN